MSTIVGNIVTKVKATNPDIPPNVVASALALISGCITIAIGLARCGWIVDLISLTSLSAFMTGSALNIAVSQVPALMGSRASPLEIPHISSSLTYYPISIPQLLTLQWG